MAAYAAVVSLMNTVDDIYNHPCLSASLDDGQIKSLQEKAGFLLDFLENHSSTGGLSKEEEPDLENQIASAAHAAEVAIESHIVDQIQAGSEQKGRKRKREESQAGKPLLQRVLQKITEEDMGSLSEKVLKVKEQIGLKYKQSTNSMNAPSSTFHGSGNTTMVGFDDYLYQLLDRLMAQQSDRQIIPIVGMGGIGKTTLAINAFEDPCILQHFDVCAWVTISQRHNLKEMLLETLSYLRDRCDGTESESQLGERLYEFLVGRRYLIVLDDIWSIEAWYQIKLYLPENHDRSRIVVTTRQTDVANDLGSSAIALDFLDDDKSWELFCEKAFGQEDCPPELEETGRGIVKSCRGLPLSIVVIGGLLGRSSRTQEYWKNVQNDLSSIFNAAEDNPCLNIVSLSYSYLPAHLKPCFLYLGAFPEDYKIKISLLIRLWIADGFIKFNKKKSLEEVAGGYVMDLTARNLILVHRLHRNGKIKICRFHDLLRDFCIHVAKKEKFFSVLSKLDTSRNREGEGRITVHSVITTQYIRPPPFESASLSRSIIWERQHYQLGFKSALLRVTFFADFHFSDSRFEQVSLRFLEGYGSTSFCQELPCLISRVWNIQTIILGSFVPTLPEIIWEMTQLRHVVILWTCLPDPPLSDKQDYIVLRVLRTLQTVRNFRCSEEVLKRMPNIRKLSLLYWDFLNAEEGLTWSYYCLYNVGCLNNLESLQYKFYERQNRDDLLQNLKFPSSLKKLTLDNCGLHFDDLRMIGSLPHLEVLKLLNIAGHTWNPVEGEFLSLKFLRINSCDLICWNANCSHFPVLDTLHLVNLDKLDEIPLGLGEIPTLRVIRMSDCSASAAISAAKILEEQDSLGNDELQVLAKILDHSTLEQVRETVELEGCPTHNLRLSSMQRIGNTPRFVYFGSSVRNKR